MTPDELFVNSSHLCKHLYSPQSASTVEGTADREREVKRQLYEQAGIPEYWLVDPDAQQIVFHVMKDNGRYHEVRVNREAIATTNDPYSQLAVNDQGVYHSVAVPGLALSIPHLWTMEKRNWEERCLPFLMPLLKEEEKLPRDSSSDPNQIYWDTVPYAPSVGSQPVPISFAEYASWCPRAKFESYGGGIKIGGSEGSRRVFGMLLMTLGMVEMVKLAHPREWLTFLEKEKYASVVQQHTDRIMPHAKIKQERFGGEPYFYGHIPQLDGASAIGDTQDECLQNLAQEVSDWVLLRIARQEEIAAL